jgi:putative hydrolase of the HAD superfamily
VQTDLKAIVFDLDGTLYVNNPLGESIYEVACRYIADLKGVECKAAASLIRATRNMLTAQSSQETSLSLACIELGGDIVQLHRYFAGEVVPEDYLKRDSRLIELLNNLGQRFELYVYTNNNLELAGRIMKQLGIGGLFQHVFSIEDTWRPKPDIQSLQYIYSSIGYEPYECLFVGDRYDIDLKLPASLGSMVFLGSGVDALIPLCKLVIEENL